MDREELNKRLPGVVEAMVKSTLGEPRMQHLNRVFLPSRDEIVKAVGLLRQMIYPGYFDQQTLTKGNIGDRLGELAREITEILYMQVRCCLRYRQQIPGTDGDSDKCDECDRQAGEIVAKFLDRLPAVRELLSEDVQAAFDGDPAAQSTDETIFCYPGLLAITVQRLAHEFYKQEVPLLPRMMTEYAHGLTGIDINPGAKLGRRFFIDHGTGIVIGETAEIGDNVKIYQGVTLGAIAPAFGQALRGQKRHPTIHNDVTIYAGATILGGSTIIGEGCTIGGNVFITASVPKYNQVTADPPTLKYRDRRARKLADFVEDYQI
jgi:serine O-acetyltransferase